jgi:hypothetical protein
MMATLDDSRLPRPLVQQLRELARGAFLERATNVLAFGLPGVGKSHAACALGHALVEAGHAVLFAPAYQLVQVLLVAKRDLEQPRALRRLDGFDLVVVDDIGYVQQTTDELEVLFTFLAERYERRSVLITSNLVFSDWDRTFKNPMTPPRRSTAWCTLRDPRVRRPKLQVREGTSAEGRDHERDHAARGGRGGERDRRRGRQRRGREQGQRGNRRLVKNQEGLTEVTMSARPLEALTPAAAWSPRPASTQGDTGRNSCPRPARIVVHEQAVQQLELGWCWR